jgi:hypothetical protein
MIPVELNGEYLASKLTAPVGAAHKCQTVVASSEHHVPQTSMFSLVLNAVG